MKTVLLLALLAVFAMMIPIVSEATLPLDEETVEVDLFAMEAGTDAESLFAESFVNVNVEIPLEDAEYSIWSYLSWGVEVETACNTNETTAVERDGGDGILFGGISL